MDSDTMRGDWAAIRLMVRQQWNRLTDEDLEAIDGDREALLNVLEQRYDSPRDRLEQQVSEFEGRIGGHDDEVSSTAASQMGSQGRQLYEEDSMPRNPNDKQQSQQNQGRGANSPQQGDKRFAEQQSGSGSMDNKNAEEQYGAGSMGNKQGSPQQGSQQQGSQQRQGQGSQQGGSSRQGSQPGGQPGQQRQGQQSGQGSQGRQQSSATDIDEEDVDVEETDGSISRQAAREQADGSSRDKQSATEGDGYSKSDREQQGGQKGKTPNVPPSWQRQSERGQQPNR